MSDAPLPPVPAAGEQLNCREVIDFIAGYLDGSLAPDVARAFKYHLSLCPSCEAYLASYKQTIAMSKDAVGGGGAAPAQVPEGLLRAIRAARKKAE